MQYTINEIIFDTNLQQKLKDKFIEMQYIKKNLQKATLNFRDNS